MTSPPSGFPGGVRGSTLAARQVAVRVADHEEAFQADNLIGKPLHIALIAIPILLQVYFNSALAYGLMKLLKVPHNVAAPGALIGASNFFELAVATAIVLFGPESGAALATVVGVLVEVPVMLSVCSFCNRTRHWFPATGKA